MVFKECVHCQQIYPNSQLVARQYVDPLRYVYICFPCFFKVVKHYRFDKTPEFLRDSYLASVIHQ